MEVYFHKMSQQIVDTIDMNRVFMKLCGCGICDKTFQIEKECVENCELHYCLNPQKDTFLEVFKLHLLSYFHLIEKTTA